MSFQQLLFLESAWNIWDHLSMTAMYTCNLLVAKITAFSCTLIYIQLTTIKPFFFYINTVKIYVLIIQPMERSKMYKLYVLQLLSSVLALILPCSSLI